MPVSSLHQESPRHCKAAQAGRGSPAFHSRHDRRRPALLDIAQQLHAVEKAIAQAKKTLVHDHLDHCLEHAVRTDKREARKSVEEFKAISKYL